MTLPQPGAKRFAAPAARGHPRSQKWGRQGRHKLSPPMPLRSVTEMKILGKTLGIIGHCAVFASQRKIKSRGRGWRAPQFFRQKQRAR